MKIVEGTVSVAELTEMSKKMFGNTIKAFVDIEKEIMVIDAPMHADQEELLLESGSLQENLWGINLIPDKFGQEGFLVFDSMLNIKATCSNRTRGVDNPIIQARIRAIVNKQVRL